MPRTLPFGERIRRRAETMARINARNEQRKELRRKEKAKNRFREWSNRWHLHKYHERTAFLVPLREELKRQRRQNHEPEMQGLPASRYRKFIPEIRDICVQAACIEFDMHPLLLITPLRYAPDARTKEIIYLVWWLARHKFRVSNIEIARHYRVSAKTVRRYTQDAHFIFRYCADHPLTLLLQRLNLLLKVIHRNRIQQCVDCSEPIPRELHTVFRTNKYGILRSLLKIKTARTAKKRYAFAALFCETQ